MVVDVCQQCKNNPCKEEQQFPCNEHWHHLPSSGRQTKEICFPVLREATATVWYSYGIASGALQGLLYHSSRPLSIEFQPIKEKTTMIKVKHYQVEFQFITSDGRLTDENGNENRICIEWLSRRKLEQIKGFSWIKILNVKELLP